MDIIQLMILMGMMLGTVLGVVIPLHLQTNNRLDAIHGEMKDFHGRMAGLEERKRIQRRK